jgi:hypothetical protein
MTDLEQLVADLGVHEYALSIAPTGGGDGFNLEILSPVRRNSFEQTSLAWVGTGSTIDEAVKQARAARETQWAIQGKL